MTDSIIRKQSDIVAADTVVLVATYNALTGKSIKKFSSRAAGERQVEMAMLAAQDNDAHTGVPKDTQPKVITIQEAAAKAEERGFEVEPATEEDAARVVFTPGSLADQLDKATVRVAPIVPRAKKLPTDLAVARITLMYVVATGAGVSKVQATSTRGAIFAFITESPGGLASVAALDAKFNCNTKGYLQKLIEKNHVVPCDAEGKCQVVSEQK